MGDSLATAEIPMTPAERKEAEDLLNALDGVATEVEALRRSADSHGMRMAELIAEISDKGYWRLRAQTESEYAQNAYPGSASMYWALRQVGAVLGKYSASWRGLGISKWRYLASYHNNIGDIPQRVFVAATQMDRDSFAKYIRGELGRGRLEDKSKDMLMTIKVFSSARPIVEQAMTIAKLESGSENPSNAITSIFADYLAGHAADGTHYSGGRGNIKIAADAIRRLKHMDNLTEDVIEECVGEVSAAIASLRE